MSIEEFFGSPTGQVVQTNGLVYKEGNQELTDYKAFLPNLIPPEPIEYSDKLISELSSAISSLGELRVISERMSPFLISGIANRSITKEAQMSSRIEGTIVPTQDLILFEPTTSETNPDDVIEVRNFDNAQRQAIADIKDGRPLSEHLLKTTHETLLRGVRGEQWHPGEYRTLQNMIGSRRDIDSARYVPPPVVNVQPLMNNLIQFISLEDHMADLVRIGVAHYQFEAIHPFEDGNGRIGRLLIILMLIKLGLMEQPLIYPSAFFDANQEEYRDRLLKVSTVGDWNGWLEFIFSGLGEASKAAIERCSRFSTLIAEADEKVKGPRAPQKLFELIRLFSTEFTMTVKYASDMLGLNDLTVRNYFKKLLGFNSQVQQMV